MRDDMSKVIVERPRLRYGKKSIDSSGGRQLRNHVQSDEDGGHAPRHLGMKAGYGNRKWLNENLAPLRRWLQSQVNRPWNKIYSELCANIDRRNTVQEHIFTHIEQFVAVKTHLVDGEVRVPKWWGSGFQPVGESRVLLFVHPRTGILLPNRQRLEYQRKEAGRSKAKVEAAAACRKIVGEFEQMHLIEGIWYLVTLAILPEGTPAGGKDLYGRKPGDIFEKCWDVMRRRAVSRSDLSERGPDSARSTYGRPDLYAARKRQLDKKELKRYGVTNKAGNPGLVCFGRPTEAIHIRSCIPPACKRSPARRRECVRSAAAQQHT